MPKNNQKFILKKSDETSGGKKDHQYAATFIKNMNYRKDQKFIFVTTEYVYRSKYFNNI